MPTDSLRQTIAEAVATRFAAISAAEGYTNTLSADKVWPWRQGEIEDKDVPGIAFADTNENLEPFSVGLGASAAGKYEATLSFECQGFVKGSGASKTPPQIAELARQLLADMIKAIGDTSNGRTGQSWGVANAWTNLKDTAIQVDPGNRFTGSCLLKFEVRYLFNRFDYSSNA